MNKKFKWSVEKRRYNKKEKREYFYSSEMDTLLSIYFLKNLDRKHFIFYI